MFYNFNKDSLFFINSFGEKKKTKNKEKQFELFYLSEFLSHFFFFTYYLDPSQCDSIVFLSKIPYNIDILRKLFPQLKFYYSQLDLKYLKENDINFAIIINNDMKFQQTIIEKYEPFMALVDFKILESTKISYLDGVLLRKLFSSENSAKLIIRGISYKDWENIYIEDMSRKNYINPISNDNKTIYKERGFYNDFNETAIIVIIKDYLTKINYDINFENIIKILICILDNLIEGKKINLDIEYLIN